jgi:putative transposase
MSDRSYAEINFHITWHTKDNFPFIDSKLEPELWAFSKNRIVTMPNVYFHAIGGIPDHIHLAGSFYPPFEIDRWIGEIKGASSHKFGKALQWQSDYGVVSFGTMDLDWVVAYIRNQKEHHRAGSIHERLERIVGVRGKGVKTPCGKHLKH